MKHDLLIHDQIEDQVAQSHVEHSKDIRVGAFMQTYSGKKFWPMDPRPDEVDILDIAHSLSMQCRYAGHTLQFYSVAEHSVHIAQWLYVVTGDPVLAMWGLLHDASEAYLVDVPRPVKVYLPEYKEAEARVMKAVCEHFALPSEMPEIVHEADNRILLDERAQAMTSTDDDWGIDGDPLGVGLMFYDPQTGREVFMRSFNILKSHMERNNPGVAA